MAVLEKRSLGKTGMKATALGLGCAHLGNPNKATDEEAIEAVRHAIDLGINFVDTSAMYGRGHSERRVGLALEDGYREKVYLQTKAGTHEAIVVEE
jgi:aryl-alcohol dehydrogenase-like predicted oxidoreductase